MAKLTAKKRNALPSSAFAGPDRSFPVQDKSHAANAKARVANKSPALKARVDAKANKVLRADIPMGGGKGAGKATKPRTVGPIPSKTLSSMVSSLRSGR